MDEISKGEEASICRSPLAPWNCTHKKTKMLLSLPQVTNGSPGNSHSRKNSKSFIVWRLTVCSYRAGDRPSPCSLFPTIIISGSQALRSCGQLSTPSYRKISIHVSFAQPWHLLESCVNSNKSKARKAISQIMPWTFSPSIVLTFRNKTVRKLKNATGNPVHTE